MFRTSPVRHQARFVQAVFAGFGSNGWTCRAVRVYTAYQSPRIQLVQNAPDNGPMSSETCRANISAE